MKKLVLTLAFVSALTLLCIAQSEGVPAFHKTPPPKSAKLHPIMSDDQLWGANFQFAYQKRAYQLASKIPNVIYQLPCYCYCDRMGHESLRSCYESTHASQCSHCLKELYFAWFQTKAGKTPKQIREGIIRGEWRSIDLEQAAEQSLKN